MLTLCSTKGVSHSHLIPQKNKHKINRTSQFSVLGRQIKKFKLKPKNLIKFFLLVLIRSFQTGTETHFDSQMLFFSFSFINEGKSRTRMMVQSFCKWQENSLLLHDVTFVTIIVHKV